MQFGKYLRRSFGVRHHGHPIGYGETCLFESGTVVGFTAHARRIRRSNLIQ
ncbi:MAG: hypothetical protein ABSB32_04145 [Thermodesulfobacteriota bacterium]